jgi:uncharacterized protein with GYD domain
MDTYFMLGKYSPESLKSVSEARTTKVLSQIKKLGGRVRDVYALLGPYDLVLIVDLPNLEAAMKTSMILSRLTGICFTSSPAIKVQEFDKLATAL